jgi:hypothetical protein
LTPLFKTHPLDLPLAEVPVVFVCSPLRGRTPEDLVHNKKVAEAWCRHLTLLGHAPYAPHAFFPNFMDDREGYERRVSMRAGLVFMAKCFHLVADARAGISSGMRAEIDKAIELQLDVRVITDPTAFIEIPIARPFFG